MLNPSLHKQYVLQMGVFGRSHVTTFYRSNDIMHSEISFLNNNFSEQPSSWVPIKIENCLQGSKRIILKNFASNMNNSFIRNNATLEKYVNIDLGIHSSGKNISFSVFLHSFSVSFKFLLF